MLTQRGASLRFFKEMNLSYAWMIGRKGEMMKNVTNTFLWKIFFPEVKKKKIFFCIVKRFIIKEKDKKNGVKRKKKKESYDFS